MANEAMLSQVPLRPENVFRIHSEETDAGAAALAYEQTLRTFFALQPGEFPRFDLILLGLGPDGHTASLFPRSLALGETKRLVVANWVEEFKTDRITFTFPVLNHAACVMFLVSGAEKARILRGRAREPGEQLARAKGASGGGQAGLARRSGRGQRTAEAEFLEDRDQIVLLLVHLSIDDAQHFGIVGARDVGCHAPAERHFIALLAAQVPLFHFSQ